MHKALLSILIALLLLLCDCKPNNDERIAAYKKCRAAGMEAEISAFGNVLCVPPTDQK